MYLLFYYAVPYIYMSIGYSTFYVARVKAHKIMYNALTTSTTLIISECLYVLYSLVF